MNLWALFCFNSFIYYTLSGVYVLCKNRHLLVNRAFFAMCMNLSFWSLGYTFMISAETVEIAARWRVMSAFGWCFFYSSMFFFMLVITNKRSITDNMSCRWLLYFPSLCFFLHNLRVSPAGFVKTRQGWTFMLSNDGIWSACFDLYYMSLVLGGLLLLYKWGRSNQIRERKQARVITVTALITLVLGATTDTILPKLGVQIIPIAILFFSVVVTGMWYAITRYKMIVLTQEIAAEYIVKTMMDPVLTIGEDLCIKAANRATEEMMGYGGDEIPGKLITEVVISPALGETMLKELLEKGQVSNCEVEAQKKDGSRIPCLFSGAAVKDVYGETMGIVCVLHDITNRKKAENLLKQVHQELELKVSERTAELLLTNQKLQEEIVERENAEAQIEYTAYHDTLTGLPNRMLYNKLLESAICKAQRTGGRLAVVFLDLDNFKLINDTLGYETGDELLRKVAERIRNAVPKIDGLARVEGDEFLLFATNLSRKADIEILLQELMQAISAPLFLDHIENFITASIGAAFYPDDGLEAESLVRNADIAMYEAKNAGRNTYRLCSSDMKACILEKTALRNSLYKAMERNEFHVYYQPQVLTHTGEITGFEALLRWEPEKGHFIPPSEFIPIAEETGLIVPIGYWIIQSACEALKKCHEAGFPQLTVAVNLAANQLKQKDFTSRVSGILAVTGLNPRNLELEVTESIAARESDHILAAMQEIKNLGIKLSIDDFGTYYSSFTNIKKFPVDIIKVAMQFVQGVTTDKMDAAIVGSIIELFHSVGMSLIAEGVETEEQLDFLRSRKCDKVQGYYFYKPIPYCQVQDILGKPRKGVTAVPSGIFQPEVQAAPGWPASLGTRK